MFAASPSLSKSISVLFFSFLVISGLYFARGFLIPIAVSALLAMLFVPLSRWFENRKVSRVIASILCIVVLLLSITSIILLLSWQASDISNDLSEIGDRLSKIASDVRQFIARNVGISTYKQKQWMESQAPGGSGTMGMAGTVLSSLAGIAVDAILVLVYLFLFICSRAHLKKFVMMLVPSDETKETEQIFQDAGRVAQRYISGMSMMIVMLWIMYGIGFTIVGVENALFFAVLCGILEIVPFIGNLTGTGITLMMVISQGGSDRMIIGVLATYLFIQFVQTYILEPLIVGSEVNINPLFTILILVLMEIVWGIAGMILAIPMLGIIKIICDHIKPLKPYGFLIGKEKSGKETKLITTLKSWFNYGSNNPSKA
ncbi:MAG: AI-2E family transporter [Daejeonella sp.]